MNYQACLDYLHINCRRGTPGGYGRTVRMAELLGNPQEQLRIIHIAGTNGKGSTAALVESMLRQGGYQVGLFTSPHLERYEERIQINRQLIAPEDFAAIFTSLIEQVVPVLLAEGMGHPGEFELLTVASWLYFQQRTDFVISEVGLGGTLDPTNIIQHPVLSIITPVSLDHCQILGDTVGQIAKEKAGILKAGVPAVIAPQQPEALASIEAMAEEKQTPLIILRKEDLQPVHTSLRGTYQQMNANTALAAIHSLQQRGLVHLTEEQLAAGLQQVAWAGRMEYISLGDGKGILLDGAHNPAGVACLVDSLRQEYSQRNIVLFLSILDDKEQVTMLREILPLAARVVLTRPEHDDRAQHWQQIQQYIAEIAPDCPCAVYDSYQDGLTQTLTQLKENDLLCITGSLYLLGDCRAFLKDKIS